MATAKKVTEDNFQPGSGDGRFVVYSKQFNKLVDVVNELEPSDGALLADSVSESTLGAGVTLGAAGDKLALFGDTPVVQPTTGISAAAFSAETSGISDDTATFGGYTIGQIVAALKVIGVLA